MCWYCLYIMRIIHIIMYVYIPTYVHVRIYYVRMLCIIIDNVIIRSCSHTVRCMSMGVVVVTLVSMGLQCSLLLLMA